MYDRTLNLLNFLKGIIHLFLELSIIIFRDIKMRTWSWSANRQCSLTRLQTSCRLITFGSSMIRVKLPRENHGHSKHSNSYLMTLIMQKNAVNLMLLLILSLKTQNKHWKQVTSCYLPHQDKSTACGTNPHLSGAIILLKIFS